MELKKCAREKESARNYMGQRIVLTTTPLSSQFHKKLHNVKVCEAFAARRTWHALVDGTVIDFVHSFVGWIYKEPHFGHHGSFW